MADNQITKAELARRLGVRPQSVDYMLTRKSIDTDTLYNVSRDAKGIYRLISANRYSFISKPINSF